MVQTSVVDKKKKKYSEGDKNSVDPAEKNILEKENHQWRQQLWTLEAPSLLFPNQGHKVGTLGHEQKTDSV